MITCALLCWFRCEDYVLELRQQIKPPLKGTIDQQTRNRSKISLGRFGRNRECHFDSVIFIIIKVPLRLISALVGSGEVGVGRKCLIGPWWIGSRLGVWIALLCVGGEGDDVCTVHVHVVTVHEAPSSLLHTLNPNRGRTGMNEWRNASKGKYRGLSCIVVVQLTPGASFRNQPAVQHHAIMRLHDAENEQPYVLDDDDQKERKKKKRKNSNIDGNCEYEREPRRL